jgi:hypothetical protein
MLGREDALAAAARPAPLFGPASRDAALRRSSARRLAGANALQAYCIVFQLGGALARAVTV